MKPRFDTLPADQQAVWKKLATVPAHFVLYGGTALALRLAHRQSVDFDFFSSRPFHPDRFLEKLSLASEVMQKEKNTLTIRTSEGVKVSFFGGLSFGRVRDTDQADGIRIASLDDIFAAKLNTVYQRCEEKDYLDVDAIMQTGMTLAYGLGCARAIYGGTFNVMLPLKALDYFEDGNLSSLPEAVRQRLSRAVSEVSEIPLVSLAAKTISESH